LNFARTHRSFATAINFPKGQPWAFEISNVELRVDWADTGLLRSFRVYGGQVTGQPLVLVRGETRAVSKADWKGLRWWLDVLILSQPKRYLDDR
jgi:hypothetical protein